MQEEARLSNLVFSDTGKDETPQWKSNSWPPLLGGYRYFPASVVVNGETNEKETVVVIGGYTLNGATNSVLLMDLEKETKEWREGPTLKQPRGGLAAVVCNGFVYALKGYCKGRFLNSIERIDLEDLLKSPSTTNDKKHWTTLNCQVSTSRCGCQAAVVHNRFIVVVGGYNGSHLSSTDIIDTAEHTQHIVVAGPPMTVPRFVGGLAVVGHRIFVIGGNDGTSALKSVEYLEFMESSSETNDDDLSSVFPSSSKWKVHKDLVLSVPRMEHAVAKVGTCLIVTGGKPFNSSQSVEVLDTKRNVVFHIPVMNQERSAHCAVSFTHGIVVIGGKYTKTCETLSLINVQQLFKVRFCVIAKGTTFVLKIVVLFSYDNFVIFFQRHSRTCFRVVPSSTWK